MKLLSFFSWRPFRATPLHTGVRKALRDVEETILSLRLEVAAIEGTLTGLESQRGILLDELSPNRGNLDREIPRRVDEMESADRRYKL